MIEDVSFEIISKCPNNCLFCSSCSSLSSQLSIDVTTIKNVIIQLAELGTKRICLSGGEPFLHPDIIEIVKTINDNNIKCDIYTSGIVFEENSAKALDIDTLTKIKKYGANRLMFNFQAIDEDVYDYVMGTKQQQKYLLKSIENALSCGLGVELHYIPMKQNLNQIAKILDYAEKNNITQVSFLKLVKHGRAKFNDLEMDEQLEEKFKYTLKKLSLDNPKIRIGIPLTCGDCKNKCHAIKNKLYIKYDGSVYGCEAFKYIEFDQTKPANVYTTSIKNILENSEYLKKSEALIESNMNPYNHCPVQAYMHKG